jgi:phosphate transport system substrate-binding protein
MSCLVAAETAFAPPSVHRIFVNEFGTKPEASIVRQSLIEELKKKGFKVVNAFEGADAILSGDSEIFVKEYYSLYARAGTSPAHGKPIYGGYVSVELKTPGGETLWSYLATARSDSKDAPRHLSSEIVQHLIDSLTSPENKAHSIKK